MRYSTGNPVGTDGSSDPRDLHDNAGNIDLFTNKSDPTWKDRLGNQRKSVAGMESSFDQFMHSSASDFDQLLQKSGFEVPPLEYMDGTPLQVDRPTQLVERDGLLYSVKLPHEFPTYLSGTWAADESLLIVRADQALRSDLADTSNPMAGAATVGRSLRRINSKAELSSISGQYAGETVFVRDQRSDQASFGAGGNGLFEWAPGNRSAQVTSDPLAGLYVAPASSPTGTSGVWSRLWDGQRWDPKWWGFDSEPRGINSTNIPVSLLKSQAGASQDTYILLFGDSHGYGQGAPESQMFTTAGSVSVHSANLYNKGFMRRIEDDVSVRRGFYPCTYGAWVPTYPAAIGPGFYGPDAIERSKQDPSRAFPLIPVCGTIIGSQRGVEVGSLTNQRWYTPRALVRPDYQSLFREKLEIGLFGSRLLKLGIESASSFKEAGKTEFYRLSINSSKAASGAGFTSYSNPAGGVYCEVETATGQVTVHTSTYYADLPSWMFPGGSVYIHGYGIANVLNVIAETGGTAIVLVTAANAPLGPTGAVKCIRDGMSFYHPAYALRGIFKLPMQAPARAVYVGVMHSPTGGVLDIYFTDALDAGGSGNDPAFNSAVRMHNSSNWSWITTGAAPNIAGPGADMLAAPKASVTEYGFRIDTSSITPGVTEEVIYRIDLGATQWGVMYLETLGAPVEIRGVVLDNNKVINCSMGGHTVGAWIGDEPSSSDGAQDHVAQILGHVPVQPSHVITQIPFVNEFVRQTPIDTFKARLGTFVDKFKNHLPGSNNFNAKGVDFLFFTTLANKQILFGAGAEPAIKYADYVQATKEFCAAGGYGFIDVESALVGWVRSGQIDSNRLYSDDNHPSDYANELIFEELRKTLSAVV